ncbi:MAG: hypothetical protein ABEI31_10895 [Halodesulfurarchaeum sp.]
MASLAAETRAAVDARPFLKEALRAGVLNVAAAARYLDLEGEQEAIATALRRYAEDLDPPERRERAIRVRMERRVADVEALLAVDGEAPGATEIARDGDSSPDPTAIIASGDVDPRFVATVLARFADESLSLIGVGVTADCAVFVVPNGSGSTALRFVEESDANTS